MNRMQRINKLLVKNLSEFFIEIKDNSYLHSGHHNFNGLDQTHLLIFLKSKNITNVKRLEVHRKINNLLKDEFDNGLHSIEIKINSI